MNDYAHVRIRRNSSLLILVYLGFVSWFFSAEVAFAEPKQTVIYNR